MSPARLAAHALGLLGPVDGPIAVVGSAALADAVARGVRVAGERGPAAAAVVTFIGAGLDVAARQVCLTTLRNRLPAGAPLALVDHNQPRTWRRRLAGVAWLALRGLGPARGRYPAARELQVLGFRIERLRLVAGERIQLVGARR